MKKAFFKRITVAEKKRKGLRESSLDEIIHNTSDEYTHVIRASILPYGLNPKGNKQFIKEGYYPRITQPNLVNQIQPNITLQRLIKEAIAKSTKLHNATGISSKPLAWIRDFGKNTVYQFVECAKGIEQFVYSETSEQTSISVEEKYDSDKNSKDNGAIVYVEVPSTSKRKGRYKLEFHRIPLHPEHALKQALSTHVEYHGRVPEDTSHIISFKHPSNHYVSSKQIAGHLAIAQFYAKQGNTIPRQNLPFPIFAPEIMDLYFKCRDSVLVQPVKGSPRHLREPEIGYILGNAIFETRLSALKSSDDPLLKDYLCFNR